MTGLLTTGALVGGGIANPTSRRAILIVSRHGVRYGVPAAGKAAFALAKLGARGVVTSRGIFGGSTARAGGRVLGRAGSLLTRKVIFPLAIADAVFAGARTGGGLENKVVAAQARFVGVSSATVRRISKQSRFRTDRTFQVGEVEDLLSGTGPRTGIV